MASAAPAWYAIIDGAQDQRLEELVKSCKKHICLFKGVKDPKLANAAPWLVQIDEREALLSTWQQHGKGQSWGLMLQSDLPIDQLQGFLRRFLQAQLPDGMIVLFRFYDPRVFNTYIRAAEPEERALFFDGVLQYAVEGEGGDVLHQYRIEQGKLLDGNQPLD